MSLSIYLDSLGSKRGQDDSLEILPGWPRGPGDDPEDGEARGHVLLQIGTRGIAGD